MNDAERTSGVEPAPQPAMSWAVTAPFLTDASKRWISDFAETDRHRFTIVPKQGAEISWHTKKAARTGLREWRDFSRAAGDAMRHASTNDGGVITVFPQLAVAAASRKRLRRLDVPLVAWFFNTNFGNDLRTALATRALGSVDRFVVHSTAEIGAYADALGLSPSRFEFAHVQYGGEVQTDAEDTEQPFVFATGSGFRDYATFYEAMAATGLPTKVVAGPRALAGLVAPPNVEVLEGVDRREIHRLMRRATVNVIPMHGEGLTGGLITMVETFRHGRSIVVSDRPGIDDYVRDDDNALRVPMQDAASLADAVRAIFDDDRLRRRLNEGADRFAKEYVTDEAAARALVRVLDGVIGS